jgi:hypothetical protein
MSGLSNGTLNEQIQETRKLVSADGNGSKNDGVASTHVQQNMTSKDYYFDSYAHFGIHEVELLVVF